MCNDHQETPAPFSILEIEKLSRREDVDINPAGHKQGSDLRREWAG
jgi:hypothetical protein